MRADISHEVGNSGSVGQDGFDLRKVIDLFPALRHEEGGEEVYSLSKVEAVLSD
jgi:hypothetical protein